MSNDPTDCRDEALRVAERAEAARSSALKVHLGLLAKNLLRRSVELERLMVSSDRTVCPPTLHGQDDPESRIEALRVLLNSASRSEERRVGKECRGGGTGEEE